MRTRLLLIAFLIAAPAQASQGENPLFARTHMLPSPFTLPGGRLIVGTEVAFGITDFLQVGTSLLRDLYRVYNANTKLSLVDLDEFAFALTGEWQSYNYRDISVTNPDVKVTSWMPGFIASWAPLPRLAHFVGGQLSYSSVTQNVAGAQLSGYVQGAAVESDLSWAHGPDKHPTALVLSGGVSYDFTYELAGFGLSYHVQGLHFGLHYYPDADRYKVHPIIVGGTSFSL
ncbi:MAG TPA: hypothetical protein VM598_01410 [Bdellovibrionota bacterium]|nr:hypothetical protein [Bdellovibrionota bacterium]